MPISKVTGSTNVATTGTTCDAPSGSGNVPVNAGDVVICMTAIVATTPTVTFSKLAGTATIGSFTTNITKAQGNINLAVSSVKVTASGTLQLRATSSASMTNCLHLFEVYRGASNVGQNTTGGGSAANTDITLSLTTLNANSWCVLCCAAIQGATALTAGTSTTAEQTTQSNITGSTNDLSGFIGSNESALALSTNQALHATRSSGAVWAAVQVELLDPTRTATDSLTSSESINQDSSQPRTTTDSLTNSESISGAANRPRTSTDNLTSSDAITNNSSQPRTTTDSLTSSGVIANTSSQPRTTSDSFSSSESISKISSQPRTVTDSLSATLALSQVFTGFRTTTDALNSLDNASKILVALRTVSDSFVSLDSSTEIKTYNRSGTDSFTNSDTVTRILNGLRTTTDNLTNSESVNRILNGFRITTESLSTNDIATDSLVLFRVTTETQNTSDSNSRLVTLFRTSTDNLTTNDSVSKILDALRSISESISFSEAVTDSLILLRASTSSLTFSDLATVISGGIIRDTFDSFTSSDTPNRILIAFRILADTLSNSDTVNQGGSYLRNTNDSSVFNESLDEIINKFVTTSSIFNTSDTAVVTFPSVINVTTVDSLISSEVIRAVRRKLLIRGTFRRQDVKNLFKHKKL